MDAAAFLSFKNSALTVMDVIQLAGFGISGLKNISRVDPCVRWIALANWQLLLAASRWKTVAGVSKNEPIQTWP
jgi:hypothetical protein